MALNIRPQNPGTSRPASAPPQSASESGSPRRAVANDLRRRLLSSTVADGTDLPDTPPLDLMPQLQRSGPSIVKTRSGSVLSRGFILKTDHYPSGASISTRLRAIPRSRTVQCEGRALDLDINVHGAFFTAREAARNMIPLGGGSIVLVASMSANVRPRIPDPIRLGRDG